MTKCDYCTRQAVHTFPKENIHLCGSCGMAFREGFEKGRVYQSIDRRQSGRR